MPATSIFARTRTKGVSMSSCSGPISRASSRARYPSASSATSRPSATIDSASLNNSGVGSPIRSCSWPSSLPRRSESSYSPLDASNRYAATPVSMTRPVQSMPSGNSERMTSLT